MSRVEENVEAIKTMNAQLMEIGPEGIAGLIIHNPEIVSAIVSSSQSDIIVDISKSLAVIADGVTGEKSHSNPITLIEDKFKANGITSKEWEIWVYLREKYIFGKKVESSDDTWNYIQNLHVPVKGTSRICGFCKNSDFAYHDLDETVCHCSLHNVGVAFTCSACDSFDDVQSNMSFEEFAKKWESYFDEDETGEHKKAWLKELWFEGPKTLREKYGDIEE